MSDVPNATGTTVSVAARMDRLPIVGTHRTLVGVIGVGLFFDAFENNLSATMSKVLQTDFHLDATGLKFVLASAFIGQFFGAIFFGRFADKFGRRKAFMVNLAIYSGFSLIAAFAPNAAWLIICRFLAGLGIGAEQSLADSYLSDVLPPNRRGRLISWAYTISLCGVPAVGFLALWLVPLTPLGINGWRWLFVIGALGSAIVWFLRKGLMESPRWLEAVGRRKEASRLVDKLEAEAPQPLAEPDPSIGSTATERIRLRALFRPPYAQRTILLWIISVLGVFAYYGFGTLAPQILAAKGYGVVTSIGYAALSFLGYPLGSLLSVPVMERMERKTLLVLSGAATAVCGLGFGLSGTTSLIVSCGFGYTLMSNVFSNAYHVFMAEQYPTAIRATASGAAYSMSKLGAAAIPFALLPVLETGGPGWVFAILAAGLGLFIVLVGVLGAKTTGRSVDQVAPASANERNGL